MSKASLAPSRRQALALGAALVAVPAGAVTLTAAPAPMVAVPLSPRERIAHAVREIEAALAEIYPGARQHLVLQLPDAEAFASPVFPDGTFACGGMAMVSVTANSFSARFDAGLKKRDKMDWYGRRRA